MPENRLITVRLAGAGDNAALTDLFSQTSMPGSFSLKTTRNPDFFALCSLRGKTDVLIAETNQMLIGSVSVSICQVYVRGNKHFPVRKYCKK